MQNNIVCTKLLEYSIARCVNYIILSIDQLQIHQSKGIQQLHETMTNSGAYSQGMVSIPFLPSGNHVTVTYVEFNERAINGSTKKAAG